MLLTLFGNREKLVPVKIFVRDHWAHWLALLVTLCHLNNLNCDKSFDTSQRLLVVALVTNLPNKAKKTISLQSHTYDRFAVSSCHCSCASRCHRLQVHISSLPSVIDTNLLILEALWRLGEILGIGAWLLPRTLSADFRQNFWWSSNKGRELLENLRCETNEAADGGSTFFCWSINWLYIISDSFQAEEFALVLVRPSALLLQSSTWRVPRKILQSCCHSWSDQITGCC